jgi:hypothetical protein
MPVKINPAGGNAWRIRISVQILDKLSGKAYRTNKVADCA